MNVEQKLLKAKAKYDGCIFEVEKYLSQYIDFEFGVEHQPSDGFTVVTDHKVSFPMVIPISCVEDLIKSGKKITIEELRNVSV